MGKTGKKTTSYSKNDTILKSGKIGHFAKAVVRQNRRFSAAHFGKFLKLKVGQKNGEKWLGNLLLSKTQNTLFA